MRLIQLNDFCRDYLRVDDFNDYCPNGLQVESNDEVKHIVSGVTASLSLIEAAIEAGADTIMVHHGYFWKGEAASLTGMKGRRIRQLIRNNINLFAYHLPLDAHPEVGNNVQLARVMNWSVAEAFGDQGIVFEGAVENAQTLEQFAGDVKSRLGGEPLAIAGGDHSVRRIAWCTGAAQGFIEAAAERGVDAFVSGEVSEPTFHIARELGIHYLAAGHHATERYGIQALCEKLAERFDVTHEFIDIPNPV